MDVVRYDFHLSIPEDLSIVGYDDVGPARWPSYDITTVSQPIAAMVEATVDMLMAQIASGDTAPQHLELPGELIVRSSARVPPVELLQRSADRLYRPEGQ